MMADENRDFADDRRAEDLLQDLVDGADAERRVDGAEQSCRRRRRPRS